MIQFNHIDKHVVWVTNIYDSMVELYECLKVDKY